VAPIYTLAQYTAITRARAAGVLSTSIEGRSTTFRSLDEMDRIIASMKADLQANGLLAADSPAPIRRLRVLSTKGL
jgi:hypothetical protein